MFAVLSNRYQIIIEGQNGLPCVSGIPSPSPGTGPAEYQGTCCPDKKDREPRPLPGQMNSIEDYQKFKSEEYSIRIDIQVIIRIKIKITKHIYLFLLVF